MQYVVYTFVSMESHSSSLDFGGLILRTFQVAMFLPLV